MADSRHRQIEGASTLRPFGHHGKGQVSRHDRFESATLGAGRADAACAGHDQRQAWTVERFSMAPAASLDVPLQRLSETRDVHARSDGKRVSRQRGLQSVKAGRKTEVDSRLFHLRRRIRGSQTELAQDVRNERGLDSCAGLFWDVRTRLSVWWSARRKIAPAVFERRDSRGGCAVIKPK